jgi:hypothetical protein
MNISKFNDEHINNIDLDFSETSPKIKNMLEEALSYGYRVAKDKIKGVSSCGYMIRFFEKYNIK